MLQKKLYLVNILVGSTGDIFAKQITDRLPSTLATERVYSKYMAIDTHGFDGQVTLLHKGEVLSLCSSFFLFQGRGTELHFPMSALCANLLSVLGVPVTDSVNVYSTQFASKAFLVPLLAAHGLPVPRTLIVTSHAIRLYKNYIKSNFSFPLVLKINGKQGQTVRQVHEIDELIPELVALQNEFDSEKRSLVTIQTLIPNTYDVRAIFYKHNYIASQRRTAKEGAFLNNVSQGGSVSVDTLSLEEQALCRRVINISKIDFCGIDFIRTSDGILFLEANQVPQLEGISSLYPDLDFGSAILADIEQQLT